MKIIEYYISEDAVCELSFEERCNFLGFAQNELAKEYPNHDVVAAYVGKTMVYTDDFEEYDNIVKFCRQLLDKKENRKCKH